MLVFKSYMKLMVVMLSFWIIVMQDIFIVVESFLGQYWFRVVEVEFKILELRNGGILERGGESC